MKKTLLLCAGIFVLLSAQAQHAGKMANSITGYARADTTRGWNFSGITSLTFGQTSLHNWTAGGDNTVSGNFVFNVSLNYLSNKYFWDNNLSSEYGLVYSSVSKWQKATDKLNLTSIGGRKISKAWSVSALVHLQTQFAKGYNYPDRSVYLSTWMAPGYLDAALGFSYKPNKKYALFISPASERVTMVLNDSLSRAGAFGVEQGKKAKIETGAYLLATTNQALTPALNLISSLDMFTPYTQDFGNVNLNWNLLLSYKIHKLFSATLNTTLRYYEKESVKVQFKEIIGLGLTATF